MRDRDKAAGTGVRKVPDECTETALSVHCDKRDKYDEHDKSDMNDKHF